MWDKFFSKFKAEGKALFDRYSMTRYVRTESVAGYLINFSDLCMFVSEDSQARQNPLFKPLTGQYFKKISRKTTINLSIVRPMCESV